MTKQVQLSDAAYQALRALKREGESFSKTVLRLTKGGRDPWSFVGRRSSTLSGEERLALAAQMRGPVL